MRSRKHQEALDVLRQAQDQGVTLWSQGGRLYFDAPGGLPIHLAALLREHKSVLLDYTKETGLTARPSQGTADTEPVPVATVATVATEPESNRAPVRHLPVAARLANMQQGRLDTDAPIGASVSQDEAADLLNVSRRSVQSVPLNRLAYIETYGTPAQQELLERYSIVEVYELVKAYVDYHTTAPAPKKAERPGFVAKAKRAWTADESVLIDWFLSAPDLPTAPFQMDTWRQITDPIRYYEVLRSDIEAGPDGPRAQTRALQRDLQRLLDLYANSALTTDPTYQSKDRQEELTALKTGCAGSEEHTPAPAKGAMSYECAH